MSTFTRKSTLALIMLLVFGSIGGAGLFSQICNFASDAIICTGKVVGQEESGTFGTFTPTSQWSALGADPFGVPPTYGLRVQSKAATAIFQVAQRVPSLTRPQPYDAQIRWGTVKTSNFPPPLARLDFDYTFQDQTGFGGPIVNNLNYMSLVGAFSKQLSAGGPTIICATTGGPCFGRVGIETKTPSFTLDVNGIVRATGLVISSDKRFKENIRTIRDGMDIVRDLRGTTYQFQNSEKFTNFDFADGKQYGFVAQEVQETLPELVFTDDEGYLAVDYVSVLPILVEAIKELDDQNDDLKAELQDLKATLSEVQNQLPNSLETGLRGAELFQNVPNPFSENTQIKYYLPEATANGSLIIFDMNGGLVKEYSLDTKGEGAVQLSANDLPAGMYLYTLLADGKEIATKRMILTK